MRRIVMAKNCGNCAERKYEAEGLVIIAWYCEPVGKIAKTKDNLRDSVCRGWRRVAIDTKSKDEIAQ